MNTLKELSELQKQQKRNSIKDNIRGLLVISVMIGMPLYFDNGWLFTISWLPAIIISEILNS